MSHRGHFSDQELELLKKKKKFIIQDDMYEEIKIMTDSEIALLMHSIFEYVIHGIIPELDEEHLRVVRMTFNRFLKQHRENLDDWLHGRIQKIEAGRKGGRAKGKK